MCMFKIIKLCIFFVCSQMIFTWDYDHSSISLQADSKRRGNIRLWQKKPWDI